MSSRAAAAAQLQRVVRDKLAVRRTREHVAELRASRGAAAAVLQRQAHAWLEVRARKTNAAVVVQAQARQKLAAAHAKEKKKEQSQLSSRRMRRASLSKARMGSVESSSAAKVGSVAAMFETQVAEVEASEELNPLSSKYVGPEEHRRRIEAVHGKLKKFGEPNKEATDRALPGQLATCLNTLRFVDALNTMLGRGLVTSDASQDDGVPFESVFDWQEGAMQQRFSSAAQYLRSGKRFGLLTFEGEYPRGDVIIYSQSMVMDRKGLLEHALRMPHLIVPHFTNEGDDAALRCALEADTALVQQRDDFLRTSFDSDLEAILENSRLRDEARASAMGGKPQPDARATAPIRVRGRAALNPPAGFKPTGRRGGRSKSSAKAEDEKRPWWLDIFLKGLDFLWGGDDTPIDVNSPRHANGERYERTYERPALVQRL